METIKIFFKNSISNNWHYTNVSMSDTKAKKLLDVLGLEEGQIKIKKQEADLKSKEYEAVFAKVEELENRITYLHEEKYALSYEIKKIKPQLSEDSEFDLTNVEQIFKESSVYFGDQIKKDYNNLVEFNKSITKERTNILREQLVKSESQLNIVNKELVTLHKKKQQYINFLKEKDF